MISVIYEEKSGLSSAVDHLGVNFYFQVTMKITSGRQEARPRFAFLGSAGGTYEKRFF